MEGGLMAPWDMPQQRAGGSLAHGAETNVPRTPSRAGKKMRLQHHTPTRKGPVTPLSSPGSARTSRKRPPSTPTGSKSCSARSDRFIPARSSMDLDVCRQLLLSTATDDDNKAASDAKRPLQQQFNMAMKEALLSDTAASSIGGSSSSGGGGGGGGGVGTARVARVLSFAERAPPPPSPAAPPPPPANPLRVLHEPGGGAGVLAAGAAARVRRERHISSTPTRILDAPDLVDDYYLNLLSWSKGNVLAVALGQAVYLWHAGTGDIKNLLTLPASDYVTSVKWSDVGDTIAVGTNSAAVQLWDAAAGRRLRSLGGHSSRVGALAWNRDLVTSGGRDAAVLHHDPRVPSHRIATLQGHQQEVCGLQWSPDGGTLASGGNENFLCLWDAAMTGARSRGGMGAIGGGADGGLRDVPEVAPRLTLTQHNAAVKALAWCPFQRNLLASGGGTADRCIKFWNATSGAQLQSVDTGSQVCSLVWSQHSHELVSSHGFSQNQLCVWRYPSMLKLKQLTGHTSRVLHMDCSPDGSTIVSAAADETLRFWNIFPPPPGRRSAGPGGKGGGGMLSAMQLR